LRVTGRIAIAAVAATGAVLASCPGAWATTVTVNTRADETSPADGQCSLREAIAAVQSRLASGPAAGECPAGTGSDTIILPPGAPYTLSSELTLTGVFAISGGGAAATTIDAGGTGRVLDVQSSAIIAIRDLAITGGHAPDGPAAAERSPGVAGESGGGIHNSGSLSLANVTITSNRAGDGSDARSLGENPPNLNGGAGGNGGGIYNAGALTLDHSAVLNNRAGGGGAPSSYGPGPTGTGGAGGAGGGVLSTAGSVLAVIDSTVMGNFAGTGGPATANAATSTAGAGGTGGGIWTAAALTLTGSTISGNLAGTGGHGSVNPVGSFAPAGVGGDGGGLFDAATTNQTIVNDTIAKNSAGTGGAGAITSAPEPGGPGADGGGGGGVVSGYSQLQIVQTTIASNQPGTGGEGGSGGSGPGPAGFAGSGGGISAYGSAAMQNSLLASNTGGNCLGVVVDHGHNLSFPDASCPGTVADPRLTLLADHGGPTLTVALEPGSPAIDQIPTLGAGCPATDQRGVSRPQGAGCDIGAFEFATPAATVTSPADGAHYAQNANVTASYACSEGGITSPIASCSGPVPNGQSVDTAIAGSRTFTVTATDKDGAQTSKTVTYTVDRSTADRSRPPSIAEVKQLHRTWREGRKLAQETRRKKRPPVGTTFSFSLNEGANVTFTFTQRVNGRKVKGKCIRQTKGLRQRPACKRTMTRGTLSFAAHSGTNTVIFQGRISSAKKLRPGSYSLLITATNSAGRTTASQRPRFTIVAG
jgi:CSLREA domain-containing protein